jgi:1,4-dihydroxy-2-naphthoate octaprenyltransferase
MARDPHFNIIAYRLGTVMASKKYICSVYMLFKCKFSIPTLTAVKLVEYVEWVSLYLSLPSVLQEWGA